MFFNYQFDQEGFKVDDHYNNAASLIHDMLSNKHKQLTIVGAGDQKTQANKYSYLDIVFKGKKEFEPEFFIDQLKTEVPNSDFVIYPDNGVNKYHFIVPFDQALDYQTVNKKVLPPMRTFLANKLGSAGNVMKRQTVLAGLKINVEQIPDETIYETADDHDPLPYPVNDFIEDETHSIQVNQQSPEMVLDMLRAYLEETANTLDYGNSLTRLLTSVARSDFDPEPFLSLIQGFTKQDVRARFRSVKDGHYKAPDLAQYYVMSASDKRSELGVFLQKHTGLVPDQDAELDEVFRLLLKTFQWGIDRTLDGIGNYSDALLIFNPRFGYWINDRNTVKNLVQTIKPYATDMDVDRIRDQLTTYCKNNNLKIDPYSGSRFLLFNNGVYDVVNKQMLSLDSDYVKQLQFTEKAHIDHSFDPEAPLVKAPGHRAFDGGDWSPEDFISGYAGNDPELRRYLLFLLSLQLFSGHNFGVTVDIQGTSGWGKTTLSVPLKRLHKYNHAMVFSELNKNFPFTSYHPETGLVWLRECNMGSNTLSDAGTALYDTLCDETARFSVKGKGDLSVSHPPTVYVDGTSLIHADDLSSGPSRRTLPYCLPDGINDVPAHPRMDNNGKPMTLRNQIFSNHINEDLSLDTTISYLLAEMVKAYRETVDLSTADDLKINLSRSAKSNGLKLPDKVEVWRKRFVASSNEITDWFESDINPCLSLDRQGTLMHTTLAYAFYKEYYRAVFGEEGSYTRNMISKEKFEKLLDDQYRGHHFNIVPAGKYYKNYSNLKKRVSNLKATHFNVDDFQNLGDGKIPKEFASDKPTAYPFRSACTGWYYIQLSDKEIERRRKERAEREKQQRADEQAEQEEFDRQLAEYTENPINFKD